MNDTTKIKSDTILKTVTNEASLKSGANLIESNGWLIPNDYGNVLDEYVAFKEGLLIVDFSDHGVISIEGKDSLDFLHRMSTNDVISTNANDKTLNVLTNANGRIIDATWMITGSEKQSAMLVGSAGSGLAVAQWLEQYHFSEELDIRDESGKYGVFAVYGKNADNIAAAENCDVIDSVEYFAFVLVKESASEYWENLLEQGAVPVGREAWNIRRIELGIPRYGFELTESANPLEAGLFDSISFSKGCYIGQEVIARMDTYDKVSRQLRRLHFSGEVDDSSKPALSSDGKKVGIVTSSVYSIELGKHIGLGYIKNKYAELGNELLISESKETAIVGESFSEFAVDES